MTPPSSEPSSNPVVEPETVMVSVDVEDYFHLFIDRPESWDQYASRLSVGVNRTLKLLDSLGVRATCFVLGDAARRDPGAVRALADAGHEIASHGDLHQLVRSQDRRRFQEDVRAARSSLEDVAQQPVTGYRASSFSVTPDTPWFWEILDAEGYRFSSSLHPVRNFLYGKAVEAPLAPHRVSGTEVIEVPVVPGRMLGQAMPFSGGFYLRFFPVNLLQRAARSVTGRGLPLQWYVHTWEMDPEQPRLPLAPHWKFFRYHRLNSTEPVLRRLLAGVQTATVGEVAERARAHPMPAAAAGAE